jgi:hypothetical protein
VVDAGALLSEWNLTEATTEKDNTSPATLHLKNGRIIHADIVKEAGNKVEYIVGESVYQIPKSLVQEIVHSGNAVVQNDRSQRSPKSQASQSGCEGDSPNVDSRIPCHVVFCIQVLMGLGETQRFALFDQTNHDLTAQAQWTIIDYGPLVDFSVVNGVPQIVGKRYGMVELYATVGDDSAMTRVYISKLEDIAGNKMGRRGTPTVVGTPARRCNLFLQRHRVAGFREKSLKETGTGSRLRLVFRVGRRRWRRFSWVRVSCVPRESSAFN